MSDALGLSLGMTNMVAARPGQPPVTRPSVSSQEAAALEALARTLGGPPATVVVAVPAHWGPAPVGALRATLRSSPFLSAGGVAPVIVSDATAALTALQARPGFPPHGVVALCDFGGSGSSITLADAGAGLQPIGETVRASEFSGDLIDRAVLHHVLAGMNVAGPPPGLDDECRRAKERLSTETATTLTAEAPGRRTEVRITRAELDELLAAPFDVFLDALGDILERNRIPATSLAAVATVGGGAAIPAVTRRLSTDLRVPVITIPAPGTAAAVGAAMLAARSIAPDAPTGLAPTAADAPTGLAPSAWAAGVAGSAATQSASDGSPSATYRALAWSEDDGDTAGEPVPYLGEDYRAPENYAPEHYPAAIPTGPTVAVENAVADGTTPAVGQLPWFRRPPLLFGIAAALAALAVGGLALTLSGNDSTPTTTTTRVTKPGEPPSPVVPQTITVTGGNGQTTVTTVTPPPPTTTEPSTAAPTTTTPACPPKPACAWAPGCCWEMATPCKTDKAGASFGCRPPHSTTARPTCNAGPSATSSPARPPWRVPSTWAA